MEPLSTLDLDPDLDFSPHRDEKLLVQAWRAEQLRRLGFSDVFADAFADFVDWHELAALVARGCPPMLALEIVR
jgi:hypothetical protein